MVEVETKEILSQYFEMREGKLFRINCRIEKNNKETQGHLTKRGYWRLTLYRGGKKYTLYTARVIYLLSHRNNTIRKGYDIDHHDGDTQNNDPSNLICRSRKDNIRKCKVPRNNTSGYKGVSARYGKFRAYIKVDGKNIHIGSFATAKIASDAYMKAAKKYFGSMARRG